MKKTSLINPDFKWNEENFNEKSLKAIKSKISNDLGQKI